MSNPQGNIKERLAAAGIPDFIDPADSHPNKDNLPQEVTQKSLAGLDGPVTPVVDETKATLVIPQTQEDIDRETSLVRLKTEQLRLRKEMLELEKLEDDVRLIQRKRQAERLSQETVQDALKFEREHQIEHETNCTHMKGGQSESMLGNSPSQGVDNSNYCLIDHTFSTGVRFKMCQRCGKTWFPKDPDYGWAMTRPSRNSRSIAAGGAGMVRDWKKVQIKSSVPHKQRPQQEYANFE